MYGKRNEISLRHGENKQRHDLRHSYMEIRTGRIKPTKTKRNCERNIFLNEYLKKKRATGKARHMFLDDLY